MKTFKKLRKRFLSGALALLLAVQLLAPYAYADEINSFSEQGDELAVENLIENEISENDGTDEEGAENSSTGSDNVIGEDDSNAAAEDDVGCQYRAAHQVHRGTQGWQWRGALFWIDSVDSEHQYIPRPAMG